MHISLGVLLLKAVPETFYAPVQFLVAVVNGFIPVLAAAVIPRISLVGHLFQLLGDSLMTQVKCNVFLLFLLVFQGQVSVFLQLGSFEAFVVFVSNFFLPSFGLVDCVLGGMIDSVG